MYQFLTTALSFAILFIAYTLLFKKGEKKEYTDAERKEALKSGNPFAVFGILIVCIIALILLRKYGA